MFKKSRIIALLGVSAALIWPVASLALTCPATYTQKIVSGKYYCVKTGTGSIVVELLTQDPPGGLVTLAASPVGVGFTLCRNKGGNFPPGQNPSSVPANFFPTLVNTTSLTTPVPDGEYEDLDIDIQYRTILSVTPTPTQQLRLNQFCPNRNWTAVGYVPGAFNGTLTIGNLGTSILNDTGGACTATNVPTYNQITGTFNYAPYSGGCGSDLGNEFVPICGETELPADGVDNNCDGKIDDCVSILLHCDSTSPVLQTFCGAGSHTFASGEILPNTKSNASYAILTPAVASATITSCQNGMTAAIPPSSPNFCALTGGDSGTPRFNDQLCDLNITPN